MNEKIFDIVMRNLKNPRFYGLLLSLIVLLCFLFPYLDANLFYYKRINDRVDILSKVASLDESTIRNNPTLQKEYESILSEISNQPESMLTNLLVKETNPRTNTIKFISGGVFMWFLAICCFFINGFEKPWHRIIVVILFILFGTVLGFIAKATPNILSPWVNYIGFPIIELIVLALFITSSKKEQNKNTEGDKR